MQIYISHLYICSSLIIVTTMPRRKYASETVPVSTRITKSALEEIEEIIKNGYYTDLGDYLRDIIRNDLEARKAEREGSE